MLRFYCIYSVVYYLSVLFHVFLQLDSTVLLLHPLTCGGGGQLFTLLTALFGGFDTDLHLLHHLLLLGDILAHHLHHLLTLTLQLCGEISIATKARSWYVMNRFAFLDLLLLALLLIGDLVPHYLLLSGTLLIVLHLAVCPDYGDHLHLALSLDGPVHLAMCAKAMCVKALLAKASSAKASCAKALLAKARCAKASCAKARCAKNA